MNTRLQKNILKDIILNHHYDSIVKPLNKNKMVEFKANYNWDDKTIGEDSKFIENPFILGDYIVINRKDYINNPKFSLLLVLATDMEGCYTKECECEDYFERNPNWNIFLEDVTIDVLLDYIGFNLESKIKSLEGCLVDKYLDSKKIFMNWYKVGYV